MVLKTCTLYTIYIRGLVQKKICLTYINIAKTTILKNYTLNTMYQETSLEVDFSKMY